ERNESNCRSNSLISRNIARHIEADNDLAENSLLKNNHNNRQIPPVSKQKLKACKASQASVNARKAAQHEKIIQNINKTLIEIDDDKLQLLIDRVKQLPDDQLKSAIHLLDTMRYFKGPNEGKAVAQAIFDTFNHFKLNSQQCFACVSDNTNYMSGKVG
ncbi:30963_t:CDS:2, partial [Racocetra persica]